MSFFKWSKTANNNANADGTINWAEGQAPSTVNDSARVMMAAAAKYRDDIAGVTTGGTATAYTVASNQAFDSFARAVLERQPIVGRIGQLQTVGDFGRGLVADEPVLVEIMVPIFE